LGKRGFIGPLGDDLPSIFPIVTGVMLFITTMVFLNSQVAARSDLGELKRSALELSYITLDKGFYSKEDFDKKCVETLKPFAEKSRVDFIASLQKHCDSLQFTTNFKELYNPDFPLPGGSVCSDLSQTELDEVDLNESLRYSFPVSVECSLKRKGIGLVNILVWRSKG
jgi:hypothetical protein